MGGFTAQQFHFGDFTLDQSRYCLLRGTRTLRMEKVPMELLLLLVQRRGELVSREEIADRIWGRDVFLDIDHSINTAIRKIRRALRDDPEQPRFIETVVGKGYRFGAPVTCNEAGSGAQQQEPSLAVELPGEREIPQAPTRLLAVRTWLLLAGVAVLTLGIAGYRQLSRDRAAAVKAPAIQSLAVLPLRNLSGEPAQEYLADGMTEALIGRLSGIDGLRVISRTSVMGFKDTRQSVPEIARTLGVDAVVEGSILREGRRVRISAQLIRGTTDEHLWSKTYDRDLNDLLDLESEVSQAIAREVGVKITPQAERRLERRATTNPEARDAYLRALYFIDQDDAQGATKCLQYFQQAIALDPDYAAAYAGLARCYDLANFFDLISWREASAKIKAAVTRAVELDDELGEAHAELADYYLVRDWDFGAAEREYERALELDPNSSIAHRHYAGFLMNMGRLEQALQEIGRARELDPLSLHFADDLGWLLMYSRRYDQAVDQFRSVLEMNPNFRRSRWGLARTHELKGMYQEAVSECEKIPALPNIDAFAKALFQRRCSLYRKVYTSSGTGRVNAKWYETARQEIKDAISRDEDAYSIATLYAATGEAGKALDLLERAYAEHDSALLQLKADPRMDKLRSSARFQALLRRMNFPE